MAIWSVAAPFSILTCNDLQYQHYGSTNQGGKAWYQQRLLKNGRKEGYTKIASNKSSSKADRKESTHASPWNCRSLIPLDATPSNLNQHIHDILWKSSMTLTVAGRVFRCLQCLVQVSLNVSYPAQINCRFLHFNSVLPWLFFCGQGTMKVAFRCECTSSLTGS